MKDWHDNWIEVKDKLPEPNTEVLVVTAFGTLNLAYYEPKEGWHLTFNGRLFTNKPIAWQPLPTAHSK